MKTYATSLHKLISPEFQPWEEVDPSGLYPYPESDWVLEVYFYL